MREDAQMSGWPPPERLREENEQLRAAIAELRNRLSEPEEIVRAVRQGEVDAFVISEPEGTQIYSLRSAEQLYRSMIEEMQEGVHERRARVRDSAQDDLPSGLGQKRLDLRIPIGARIDHISR